MFTPHDINREAVKAHAVIWGVREAARAFNLNENTVKSWSKREQWLLPARTPPAPAPSLPVTIAPKAAPNTPSPSQAARYSEERLSQRSKLYAQRYVTRALKGAARLRNEEALAQAQNVKAVAGTGQIVFKDWRPDTDQAAATLALHLHVGTQAPPCIDV